MARIYDILCVILVAIRLETIEGQVIITTLNGTTATTSPPPACEDGWSFYDATGACYFLVEDQLSWEEANMKCQGMDSELASIHSGPENEFLLRTMVDYKVWIGLNDLEEEEVWEWSDGSEVNYEHWAPDESNNFSPGEHCVEIVADWWGDGRRMGWWNDFFCDTKRSAICKKVGNSPSPPVDCVVSEWGCWTECTQTCGTGQMSRTRTVEVPPMYGGKPCGDLVDYEFCHKEECPADCVWTTWSKWSACSKECGGGVQTRSRSVESEAVAGGKPCVGEEKEEQFCNKEPCPGCPEPTSLLICDNDGYPEPLEIMCPAGETIFITDALYGRIKDIPQCPNSGIPNNDCGNLHSKEIVSDICQGLESCSVSTELFGDPCVGTDKYLQVDYLCL